MAADTATTQDTLSIDRIRQDLSARTVGHRLCLYDTVPSTNLVLRDLARSGAAEGTVVLAEAQTAGQGRSGKTWFSPPGVNLYASILLRPAIPPAAAPVFTFAASLALADAVVELGLTPAIKWPNDLLVGGRKVAGVRAEMATTGDALEYVILGVGVNLNVSREALRQALGEAGQAATSLATALGRPVDRSAFVAAFLNALDEWLVIYRERGAPALLAAWRDLDVVTGRRVEVREGAVAFDGRALGVAASGHLEVQDALGRIHEVVGAEIRLLE